MVKAGIVSTVLRAAAAEIALKRTLSFPVCRMWQRWVRGSSEAVALVFACFRAVTSQMVKNKRTFRRRCSVPPDASGCGGMGLTGARISDQQHVIDTIGEVTAAQLAHGGLVDRAGNEVEAGKTITAGKRAAFRWQAPIRRRKHRLRGNRSATPVFASL